MSPKRALNWLQPNSVGFAAKKTCIKLHWEPLPLPPLQPCHKRSCIKGKGADHEALEGKGELFSHILPYTALNHGTPRVVPALKLVASLRAQGVGILAKVG